jgi:hypothetical protein
VPGGPYHAIEYVRASFSFEDTSDGEGSFSDYEKGGGGLKDALDFGRETAGTQGW